ncbi:MAG: DUF4330 family protein [Clostridia bacterium]|nr:DUF4330 family protein [Clostridia bacterium]
MIIDEKGKLFGKLNLLDLILLILLVAIIVVACFFFSGKKQTSATIPVVYTVEVQNKDAAYFENVVTGETVKDGITGAYVGKIVGFDKNPALLIGQADDKLVASSPEGRYDGLVKIEIEANVSYPDMFASDIPLKIGTDVSFRSESLAMHGYIVDIDYDAEALRGLR